MAPTIVDAPESDSSPIASIFMAENGDIVLFNHVEEDEVRILPLIHTYQIEMWILLFHVSCEEKADLNQLRVLPELLQYKRSVEDLRDLANENWKTDVIPIYF